MSAKIRKNKLDVEFTYDFELMGVRTSLKGYKLAWQLNKILNFNLAKQKDLVIHYKKGVIVAYDHYAFRTPLSVVNLFRNKPSDTESTVPALVPEFPHFDFIIMTQSRENMPGDRLLEHLKTISSVELAALIPLSALKSKDNFIF